MSASERPIVVYDACVLYPAPLRSLLMHLAVTDLFHARWTDTIHVEWMRSVLRDHDDMTQAQVERIRDLMNAHVRDCLVTSYEHLIPSLSLPDPDDRHVLAAAIHAQASLIVTTNLVDFPAGTLAQYGIEARHPDNFVLGLWQAHPETVCTAARRQRASLKRPPKTPEEYLATLARQGLPKTAAALGQHLAMI